MAYGTDAGFDAYLDEMGYTLSETAVERDVTAARARASLFIDAWYGYRFAQMGVKTGGRPQLFMWPRTGAYDGEGNAIGDDEEPAEVIRATYEATIQELENPQSLQPIITASKVIKKVSIEGAVSVEYANTNAHDTVPRLTILDGILAPLWPVTVVGVSPLYGTAFRV